MSGGGGPRRWPGLCVLLLSCAARPEPAPKGHPATNDGAPVPTASAVAVSSAGPEVAPSPAPPIASAVPVASAPSAVASAAPSSEPVVPAPKSGPPAVPCKSVQDCWVSAKHFPATPIPRPKHLVGKAFKPCVDGEVAPTCTIDHVCGLLGYDC